MEDKSIHITENIAVPPGQVTSIRISHKTFQPGQIILVEKDKKSRKSPDSVLNVHNRCFVVDENQGFNLILSNPTKSPIRLKAGRRLSKFCTIDEQSITYMNIEGEELGNRETLVGMLSEVDKESPVKLCSTHKWVLSGATDTLTEVSCIDCRICHHSGLQKSEKVVAVSLIDNALMPHCDQANVEGDRKTKLKALLDQLEWNHLTDLQKEGLREVILENDALFILGPDELGDVRVPEAHIEMTDANPVRLPLYRQPEQARKIIADMIGDMLQKDVIEESTAVYLSPIVLVNKPDGTKRLCIDYRGVNKKIKLDIQPLPRLDELVEDSAGKKFYCTLDMKDAYYQVVLDEDS